MRLTLHHKNGLSPDQLRHLDRRLAAPEHRDDNGPCRVWHTYQSFLYAFVHKQLNLPIAISEASGRPMVTPGWWIGKEFRGEGYGNELVDLLAAYLVADGASSIGLIPIDTHDGFYNEQSAKLARRFRARFAEAVTAQTRTSVP